MSGLNSFSQSFKKHLLLNMIMPNKSQMFARNFEKRVQRTIRDYELFDRKKDKIIVSVSGGKDSMTVLYLLQKFHYPVEALYIDLKIGTWSKINLEHVESFCKQLGVKLHVVDIQKELGHSMCYIRDVIKSKSKLKNCTICGVIRRWLVNKKAREFGATKLATGHNLDDEAQTILMNMFKKNMKLNIGLGPKSGVICDDKFVQRVKPLYFSAEKDVRKYSKMMKFPVQYKKCPCISEAFRKDIRPILDKLEKRIVEVKANIVNSFLETLPALRASYQTDKTMKYCSSCGEPCRDGMCYACKLFLMLKE
jgi:uncharacterized protein (TIGR00269 family)